MGIYQSFLGALVIFSVAWLCSTNRKSIRWRTVLPALALQISFGAIALYIPQGRKVFACMASGFSHVLGYADTGIRFLFGSLADHNITGFVFAINVLSVIIFFSALLSILYHLGIMQFVVKFFGGILGKILKTSKVESLYAVANIFLGQSESPLAIKPYISRLTHSELFTAMTCGMAAVAGAVLGGYAQMGVDIKFLIAASFMAAPGAVFIAKILVPETEKASDNMIDVQHEKHANVLDAAASGASAGVRLAMNVGAMLLAFMALIALLNGILGWIGSFFGDPGLSMQQVLGYVFSPIAWLLGVPWTEAVTAGGLIGQKIIINEFVAYAELSHLQKLLSEHATAVVTFALCGFANLSSIAIQLGLFGSIAPERRSEIARMGLLAVLAGTLSNLMSAAIAGFFLALHGAHV